jgi:hypothetical protein
VSNNILVSPADDITAVSTSAATGVTFDANLIDGRSNVTDPHELIGDPLLADPARGDFRLRKGSPAIDSGAGSPAAPADASNTERTGKVDRGALEFR